MKQQNIGVSSFFFTMICNIFFGGNLDLSKADKMQELLKSALQKDNPKGEIKELARLIGRDKNEVKAAVDKLKEIAKKNGKR